MPPASVQPRSHIEFVTVEAHQVEIPPTTRERYITGVYALNVQAPEGTSGDWHDVFHWNEGVDDPDRVILGGTDEVDTNHIYGDLGVYEGKDRLLAKGVVVAPEISEVWVANHYRAILDMLYRSLSLYGKVFNLTGATVDWLDTLEQQQYVLEQATRMSDYLPEPAQVELARWIESEMTRF